MKPEYKLVAKSKYIELTAELADEIWRECYARRLNKKQLDAVLETLQSAERIEADMDEDYNYFLVLLAGKPVGYFAWQMRGGMLYLAHIYLKQAVRKRGIGHDILASIERLARADGKTAVAVYAGAKELDTQGFFKSNGYRLLRERENPVCPGVVREEVYFEKHL